VRVGASTALLTVQSPLNPLNPRGLFRPFALHSGGAALNRCPRVWAWWWVGGTTSHAATRQSTHLHLTRRTLQPLYTTCAPAPRFLLLRSAPPRARGLLLQPAHCLLLPRAPHRSSSSSSSTAPARAHRRAPRHAQSEHARARTSAPPAVGAPTPPTHHTASRPAPHADTQPRAHVRSPRPWAPCARRPPPARACARRARSASP
jgi:hypothetical protein